MRVLERPAPSEPPQLNRCIRRLHVGASQLPQVSLANRRQLIARCIDGVAAVAEQWVSAACRAKGTPNDSPSGAEDLITGPIPTIRFLQLLDRTLADIQQHGRPRLPGRVKKVNGQLRARVFPAHQLYDRLLFRPMTAETWLRESVNPDDPFAKHIDRLLHGTGQGEVTVVLGAGNVSSIPATDALTKILIDNCAVLLKMNPVNDYLGPLLETALRPLVDADFLEIAYGGAEVGQYLIDHPLTTSVHITGSTESHNAIVWGSDDQERQQRRRNNQPQLNKTITSELGNVSPWAIVPSHYTPRQLRAQAENVVASIVNNASFNCIATKLILTSRNWSQREQFLELVNELLEATPKRLAYYPGAAGRFEKFSGRKPDDPNFLPWTLLTDVEPKDNPHLMQEESFVCVCAEMSLDCQSETGFLEAAVKLMNQQVRGTLAATITVGDSFRKRHLAELERAIEKLRYGTIGINVWPALSFAWMTPPWGGYPGADLHDPQSGIGFVHNTFLLDDPEKTVIRAPLTLRPKPIWFSNHRHPAAVGWSLLNLYRSPSLFRLTALSWHAFTG